MRMHIAVFGLLVLSLVSASAHSDQYGLEIFSAVAVNRGAADVLPPLDVEIAIARWTAEAASCHFATEMLSRGPDALMMALQATGAVGRIVIADSDRHDVQLAWQEPIQQGGRRIVLIVDRPLVAWKDAMRTEGVDDAFTVIEIRLDANGDGEGKVAVLFYPFVNDFRNVFQLEDYDPMPVRLAAVHARYPSSR